jgi:hypothetical protein
MAAGRLAIALVATITGCNGNTSTPVASTTGYEPLETCTAPWPTPTTTDPYPETQTMASGTRDGVAWAHSRAYVHATIAATWAALQDPNVCRIHGPTWTVTPNVEPQFPVSFLLHYVQGSPIGDVKWDIDWREGPLEGTVDQPTSVGCLYQKTNGTTFIEQQTGSIVIASVDGDPSVSSLEMVSWLQATGQGPSDSTGTLTDLYGAVIAKVHGLPVP